jgi:predicted  nucleic acid-binding Zn-ribbon protein
MFMSHVTSLEGVSQNVDQQQKTIVSLDDRLTATNNDVRKVKEEICNLAQDLSKCLSDVTVREQKLNEYFDKTSEKIIELGQKVSQL